jgi:hypothetical protein
VTTVVAVTVPPPGVLVTRTVDGTKVFEVVKFERVNERTLVTEVLFWARARPPMPMMQSKSWRKNIVATMTRESCGEKRWNSKNKKADFVSALRPQTPNLEMVSKYRIPRTREMELGKVYFGSQSGSAAGVRRARLLNSRWAVCKWD